MKKKFIIMIAAILALSTFFTVFASADYKTAKWVAAADYKAPIDDYAYSFAVVGDTQILTREDGGDYARGGKKNTNYTAPLFDWIVKNVETKKIKYVMGLGDITEMSKNEKEWKFGQENIFKLNGVVPYSLVRGNHDDTAWFTREVGTENPDYLATIEGSAVPGREATLNNYRTFEIYGIKYMVMVLDYLPTDSALEWAAGVIESHPEHRVIITTHSYLYSTGGFVTTYDPLYAPHGGNNGKDMWEKLVKKYENIFMVICGHVSCDEILVKQQKGDHGNTVTTLLIDPQELDDTSVADGNSAYGMIAMLYFSKDGKYVYYEYYSTIQDLYVDQTVKRSRITPYGTEAAYFATEGGETTDAPAGENTTADDGSEGGCGNTISLAALPIAISAVGITAISSRKRCKK